MKSAATFIHAFAALACTLLLLPIASAQTQMTPEQVEEAKQQFNKAIEQRVIRVLEGIEVTEEQLKPMQQALVQFFAPVQIEQSRMRAERQKMEAEGGRPDRQAMMQRRQKLEKLRSDLNKKVKGILDKKQYKSFQSTMEKLMPQQRRGPGGPGGGRGGR